MFSTRYIDNRCLGVNMCWFVMASLVPLLDWVVRWGCLLKRNLEGEKFVAFCPEMVYL